MTSNEDAFYRVSADFENRDDAERFKTQIENMQSVSQRAMLIGDSSDEEIAAIASSLTREKQIAHSHDHIVDFYTMNGTIDIANTIRDQNVREIDVIAALVCRNANNERAIESLRRDVADHRAAQSLADPAGGHPYRSAARPATAGPSSPVAASKTPPTTAWSSGVWQRVCGALRACAVSLTGLGLFWFMSPTHPPPWAMAIGCVVCVTVTLGFRAIGWFS